MSESIYDLPRSMAEAIRLGSSFYFTGKPCKNGHVSKRRVRGACHECNESLRHTEAQKAKRRLTTANWNKVNKHRKYGLNSEDVAVLRTSQNDRCAICCIMFGTDRRTRPNVDHCHQTGRVRGLLCHACNRALGFMRDDPTRLLRAAEYVR